MATPELPGVPTNDPTGIPLEQDPAYLAYLRSSGLVNDQALASYNRRTAAMQAALQAALPGMQRDAATEQRNLAGSNESRGMLASGGYLRDAAELADRQLRQRNAAIAGVAGDIGNEADQLAATIAENQRRAAEVGLDAANRQTQRQYQGY